MTPDRWIVTALGVAPGFGKSARLPEGETLAIEFMLDKPGEFEFSCQMGMFRGSSSWRSADAALDRHVPVSRSCAGMKGDCS